MNEPDEPMPDGTPGAPADQDVPDRLVFTSSGVLMVAVVGSMVLMLAAMFGWYAIGPEIRSRMTWPQAATLLFFLLFMIGAMMSIGYSRLWADEDGVVVRNGPVVRRFRIDEIAGLRLRQGDAWAYLLIKEGSGGIRRRAVLSIQQMEGAGARRKMRDLRAWLKANGATSKGITPDDEPTSD